MNRVAKSFTISPDMVRRFAALTGDRNPLHLDERMARKFRYRRPVVHGMLPFSFIVCLEEAFPGSRLTFAALNVRFQAPVFTGIAVRLEADISPAGTGLVTFAARWTAETGGERLIEASGTFRVRDRLPDTAPACDPDASLVSEEVRENAYRLDELAGKSESLPFSLDPAVLSRFQVSLFGPALGRDDYAFCPNLAGTLLLSTLVGMRLPGRYATFTGCRVAFDRELARSTPGVLAGTVERVSPSSESVSMSASFSQNGQQAGTASMQVLLNPPPRTMIGCDAIKARYLDPGVRGKVVVITGSSRGIGETAAKLFAMHGARTVVHYHRGQADADAIVAEIRDAGGTALALGCDIRAEDQVSRFFADALAAYGRVDVLINNAVHDFRPTSLAKLRWDDYLEELDVSLKGLHNCCRAVIPIFRQQGGGKIVNLSSVAVDHPVPGQNKYITAKSAVVGYTRSLATELAGDNVQVNLVVPAMTETDLLSSIPSELVRRIGEERACGRNLAPIEVALAMLYLSSAWADGISGQRIVLNLGEPPFA